MFFKVSILSLLFAICESQVSVIGNYSHILTNYSQCGISRNTLRTENNCLEYNQEFRPSLVGARNVDPGEAPWTVIVQYRYSYLFGVGSLSGGKCGGVLIDYQWVLTAAHCIDEDFSRIYFKLDEAFEGSYIDSVETIKHPAYKDDRVRNDIALIKLSDWFKPDQQSHYYHSNSICLPVKDLKLQGKSLAMVSGRGPGYSHMQIGPALIYFSRFDNRLKYDRKDGSPTSCVGDSGSPIWKYHNGRAYLVGIVKSIPRGRDCGDYTSSVFVPLHIDWILDTIKNN